MIIERLFKCRNIRPDSNIEIKYKYNVSGININVSSRLYSSISIQDDIIVMDSKDIEESWRYDSITKQIQPVITPITLCHLVIETDYDKLDNPDVSDFYIEKEEKITGICYDPYIRCKWEVDNINNQLIQTYSNGNTKKHNLFTNGRYIIDFDKSKNLNKVNCLGHNTLTRSDVSQHRIMDISGLYWDNIMEESGINSRFTVNNRHILEIRTTDLIGKHDLRTIIWYKNYLYLIDKRDEGSYLIIIDPSDEYLDESRKEILLSETEDIYGLTVDNKGNWYYTTTDGKVIKTKPLHHTCMINYETSEIYIKEQYDEIEVING